jgi:hypothetical protein
LPAAPAFEKSYFSPFFAISVKDDLSFFSMVFEPQLFSRIWQKYGSAKV